jgi:hypothetical protein
MTNQTTGPVRQFKTFHDVTEGPEVFYKNRAAELTGYAAEIVSRYAGPIILDHIREVYLPLDGQPITPNNFKLDTDYPFTLLTTARELQVDNDSCSGTVAMHFLVPKERSNTVADYNQAISAHCTVSSFGDAGDSTIAMATMHEIGHTFLGPDHCPDKYCAMQAQTDMWQDMLLLTQKQHFCDDCATVLQKHGEIARNTTLI